MDKLAREGARVAYPYAAWALVHVQEARVECDAATVSDYRINEAEQALRRAVRLLGYLVDRKDPELEAAQARMRAALGLDDAAGDGAGTDAVAG